MDNLNNASPVAIDKTAELQNQLDSLRQTIGSVLIIVFILAGSFNIYLWRQLRTINAELAPLKPQAAQIAEEMNKTGGVANEFAKRLIDYGKTHADFAPILNKYNLREIPATNAPAPAAKTAPASAPAKK